MSDELKLNGKAVHSQVVEFLEKFGDGSVYKGLHRCRRMLEHMISDEAESLKNWFDSSIDTESADASDCITVAEIKCSYLQHCESRKVPPATTSELYAYIASRGLTKSRLRCARVKDRLGYKKAKLYTKV